jgi:hypothetical protein
MGGSIPHIDGGTGDRYPISPYGKYIPMRNTGLRARLIRPSRLK